MARPAEMLQRVRRRHAPHPAAGLGVRPCHQPLHEPAPERVSDAGRVGSSGEAVYSAAKGAVIAFSKATAREMARHQVNINCVCPGPTDTPLFASIGGDNPKLREALTKAIPFRRLADPSDLANAVAFFASDEAAYITGQTVSVSGGLTMS